MRRRFSYKVIEESKVRDPYRVGIWGPGSLGQSAIRQLVRLPETELVAVMAYSDEKNGVDAGDLVGIPSTGVRMTTDMETFISARPEVVLHTARDFGDFRSDEEIIALLEAGIDVISVLPYQYPIARGQEAHDRLQAAALKGGATLHGTGIDPGFLYERLAATMTGMSNEITQIRLEEYFNCSDLENGGLLELYGFGTSLEEMEQNEVPAQMAENYLTMGIQYLADNLGVPIKNIERKSHHKLTANDIKLNNGFSAKAGTVGTVSFEWLAYTEDDLPMFQVQVVWYLDGSMRPDAALADGYWIIEIEGTPSSRLGLEIKGSMKNDLMITERDPTPGAYLATMVPAVQAIPKVVAAEPGILVAEMPEFYWKPDMRR
ncbi:MAG: hypothetical protein P8Y48_16665 [Novosphingobium sp.]